MYNVKMENLKVLLLEDINTNAHNEFSNSGIKNIKSFKHSLSRDELIEQIKDTHIIGIRSRTQLDSEILSHAKNLLAIGCYCIGTNQVDLEYANSTNLPVYNAPYSNSRSVSEKVISDTISLLRNTSTLNAKCHRNAWYKTSDNSFEARGKTIGIIGYGNIGSQVGLLSEAIGMEVIFYDLEKKLSFGRAKQVNTLEELAGNADIITLHVPETDNTRNLINHDILKLMKHNAILINTSRGKVVNITDLSNAIQNKAIKGASIDVFPTEPASNGDNIFTSPLIGFDNVILTPHVGGSTEEAQKEIGKIVSSKIIDSICYTNIVQAVNYGKVISDKWHSSRLINIIDMQYEQTA